MLLLILSLAALALGPLLYVLGTKRDGVREGLDGFVFVSIAGLVIFHVIPEVMEVAGMWALGFAALGLFGPLVFERYVKKLAREAHALALVLGMLGTVLHGLIDGMALSSSTGFGALGLAVLVHRLPVGLAVWWLLKPQKGLKAALTVLISIGVATIVGYSLAEGSVDRVHGFGAMCFQALVAGSLLHVVFHLSHGTRHAQGGWARFAPGVGGALALSALLFLSPDHEHDDGLEHLETATEHVETFTESFLELVAASAPALLIAYIMAGLISAFLPMSSARWLQRGGPLQQATKGVAFGLPLPVCSCGVVPLYKSLVERRVPLAAAIAFLVATPELGLDAVILSVPLLGVPMTLARVAAAGLLAILVGWYLGRRFHKSESGTSAEEVDATLDTPQPTTILARLKQALFTNTLDIVDKTGPWILLGLVVAAGLGPLLEGRLLAGVPNWLEVPIFALAGIPLYVCATGATPMVAVMLLAGVSPGAALAFLLTGPATNVTTFGLLGKLHGKSVALSFAIIMLISTITLGYLLNTLDISVGGMASGDHEHSDAGLTAWESGTTATFFLLLSFSLIRQGPRVFAGRVLSWTNSSDEDEPEEPDSCCSS